MKLTSEANIRNSGSSGKLTHEAIENKLKTIVQILKEANAFEVLNNLDFYENIGIFQDKKALTQSYSDQPFFNMEKGQSLILSDKFLELESELDKLKSADRENFMSELDEISFANSNEITKNFYAWLEKWLIIQKTCQDTEIRIEYAKSLLN